MDSDFRIRPARSADIEGLAALERVSFSDPWTVEQLSNALSWLGAVGLVAEDGDGNITGYVVGRVIVDEGEILTIATEPQSRRMGIGRGLLTAVMDAMAARGAHSAWLEVRRSNAAALGMYEHAGFVAAGVRRGYYRLPPEDALILRRTLGPTA